jgi:hypothetical protein
MRFIRTAMGLSLAGWLAAAGEATAQVTVEAVPDQEQYLRDESLTVEVRITNRSGQDLRLGQGQDWLTFTIERQDGRFMPLLEPPPFEGEFTVESSMVVKRRFDLMPYFKLGDPGHYRIAAQLKIPQWDQEVSSKPRTFDIIRGTPIWEQRFGVPATEGVPEIRRYELLQANNFKRLMLYLRLTDASDTKVFRVLALGPLVSFSRPEAQLDKQSNLHLLVQTGARSFSYHVINPAGEVLIRQVHDYGDSRPELKNNAEGKIFVNGGVRRPTSSDIPSVSPSLPEAPPIPAGVPVTTNAPAP